MKEKYKIFDAPHLSCYFSNSSAGDSCGPRGQLGARWHRAGEPCLNECKGGCLSTEPVKVRKAEFTRGLCVNRVAVGAEA